MTKSKVLFEPYVCSYCSHVDTYGIRFYKDSIDVLTKLNELPDYIGAGLCRINNQVAHISRVTFNGDNKLSNIHLYDCLGQCLDRGAHTMIYERHKPGGGVIQYHYSTIDKKCFKRVTLK